MTQRSCSLGKLCVDASLTISFRGKDGEFGEPVYTVPQVDDGDVEQ